MVLPMIGKRWAQCLREPHNSAWAEVLIDIAAEFPERDRAPDPAAMAAWFSRRAESVIKLRVTRGGGSHKLPAGMMGEILTSQAASLRELYLTGWAVAVSSADLAALGALTQLQQLTIHAPESTFSDKGWREHVPTVITALSQLPALQMVDCGRNAHFAPTAGQLAALQSPTLTRLVWGIIGSPGYSTLSLVALPALFSCTLTYWDSFGGGQLQVTAASFSGAPALKRLVLWKGGHFYCEQRKRLQLSPRCFSDLSALEDLALVKSRLTEIPAGLGQTLRRLDLSDNVGLQLAPGCFSGLSTLEELNLNGCGLTAVPAVPLSEVGRTLRRLDLGWNFHLKLEPHCFNGLRVLEQLDLRCCRLKAVPTEAFSGVGRTLRRLNLAMCAMGFNESLQLEPHCFSSLVVLEELDLSDCSLKTVPAEALSGLGRTLRRLDLSGNRELQPAPGCFSGLSALEELDLSGTAGRLGKPRSLNRIWC